MKIGILTYHRAINDGSIMQTYCLQQLIANLFPISSVEIINYCPIRVLIGEYRNLISKHRPFLKLSTFRKIKSARTFIQKNIRLSSYTCTTNKLERAEKFIQCQKYDLIVVGSDTVWEARFGKYAPYPPNIFYLPDISGTVKLSFAASADPIHKQITDNKKLLIKLTKYIRDFDLITIRDETTKKYLVDLGIEPQKIHFMPDPTILYDFSKLIETPPKPLPRPLAGVSISGKIKNVIISQLSKNGFQIIDLTDMSLNGKHIKEYAYSVNKRLGIYSMLDFLVTDRFHVSIFTLKLSGSPVLFIETAQKWPMANSKGRDLFRRLGIEEMVWRYNENNNIPNELVDRYVKVWYRMVPNIKQRFFLLKNNAMDELLRIKALRGIMGKN